MDRTATGASTPETLESGANAPLAGAALELLAASLYNKPAVPHFSEKYERNPWGQRVYGGTRFLRWHELSDEQKAKVRKQLAGVLDEIGVVVSTPVPVLSNAGPSTATSSGGAGGAAHIPNPVAGPCMSTEEKDE